MPEGLKIDMIDDEKMPMFLPGSATLTDAGKKVLDSMANIIVKTPNTITINGHTAFRRVTCPIRNTPTGNCHLIAPMPPGDSLLPHSSNATVW